MPEVANKVTYLGYRRANYRSVNEPIGSCHVTAPQLQWAQAARQTVELIGA